MPVSSEDTSFLVEWGLKIGGVFAAFVGGIVSATWAIASRVKAFEDRLDSIEQTQDNCPGKALSGINEKLDRLHQRIDEILLGRRDK